MNNPLVLQTFLMNQHITMFKIRDLMMFDGKKRHLFLNGDLLGQNEAQRVQQCSHKEKKFKYFAG